MNKLEQEQYKRLSDKMVELCSENWSSNKLARKRVRKAAKLAAANIKKQSTVQNA